MSAILETMGVWLPAVVAMAALVLASAFFSSSETALFSLSREDVRRYRLGKSRERRVAALLRDPDRLLTAILFWNLLINLCFFAVGFVVSQQLHASDHRFAAGAFGAASLMVIIVFGEVLPKSVAVVFPNGMSLWFCYPLALAVGVLDPISPGFNKLTRLARRTFWPQIKKEPYLDADDLERAVDLTQLEVDVVQHERQILHNILDLSEIRVEEVMRPRGSYLTIDREFSLERAAGQTPSDALVVLTEPGTENVTAVLPLANIAHLPEADIPRKSEPVIVVPWSAPLSTTLQEMTRRFCHAAAVVNEYGESVGIVTYDDIMDTVITPEASRARRILKREPVLEVAPGKYHVEGITTLRYLAKRLDLDYEPDSDGLHTVAGLMHDELEHIPEVGDECIWKGFRFRVIGVQKRGQLRAVVSWDDTSRPAGEEGP